jgi:titin
MQPPHPGPAPPPPPSSPANLTITGTRPDGFDFTWVDTSNDEQGFRLYRVHDDDTRQEVASFPANTESHGITGLACDTSYRFHLVSFNERGESWPSNEVQGKTNPCG